MTEEDKNLRKFREQLVAAEQKMQDEYDKNVIALAGGALGISFAFVKDLIGEGEILYHGYLVASWICWAASITSILASYFFSNRAMRNFIQKIDITLKEPENEAAYNSSPGGAYSWITGVCNALGGLLFLIGIILISFFIYKNIEVNHVRKTEDKKAVVASSASDTK